MTQAPQPRQIIWSNLHYSFTNKLIRNVIGWTITFILLFIITIIFFFVLKEKSVLLQHAVENIAHDPDRFRVQYNGAIGLVYICLVFTIIFDKFILSFFLHKIVHFEKHETEANQQLSFGIKYGCGIFFTTAFMTLAVEALELQNYTHNYGVVEE